MFGLGKKKEAALPPQNGELGSLLTSMMQDAQTNQDAFYKAFLTSNVFLIGETDEATQGPVELKGGDKIKVMHWQDPQGNPFMPIFTSLDELKASEPDASYVAMTGYNALDLTQGSAPVAIDPSNDHCLYLVPPQIAQILNYFDSLQGTP